MHRITIKELVEFRRRSDKSKKNFALKLRTRQAKEKAEDDDSGGDYWISSTSCIQNVFKSDNPELFDNKIDELQAKLAATKNNGTKSMYQRNIDILTNFKDFEFTDLKPGIGLKYETLPSFQKILTIDGYPLYVNPSLLFSFNHNGKREIGALWLVAQINGFRKNELGIFCETLYRHLVDNYASKYQISENHCIVIDTYSVQKVAYSEFTKGSLSPLLDNTIAEIKAA
ncbi:hypothetical protein [Rufibacter sp. LB8]|uniref:hypothetical protein n=1 Tax=Rufibacter sp. LB8 TaxID=2777781 RepID=UPI00178C6D50|nr:hypothetical protein [Rufibacter sp. LB8]